MDDLSDFSSFGTRTALRGNGSAAAGRGPAVVVMHEVPGITAEVARFARNVVSAVMRQSAGTGLR